jgi:hypothetical protein
MAIFGILYNLIFVLVAKKLKERTPYTKNDMQRAQDLARGGLATSLAPIHGSLCAPRVRLRRKMRSPSL